MEERRESELGKQKYWDKRYQEEIENFKDHGDPGEIWFGENVVNKIIKWIKNNKAVTSTSKILDVGCGNGLFLIELYNEGYTNLHGIDYSESAVLLAKTIAQRENVNIHYLCCNILEGLEGQFDIVHDKGTYDAINLNANAEEYRSLYLKNICNSLKTDGFFIITSCNWTKDELCEHFKNYFVCSNILPTPQFQFGGKTGNIVTSLVYVKKK